MAQEFTINSQDIETKINQLLPSQGGFGAGVDFSASTMVIPIVDLTETAEGSNVRQDLQTALSFTSITTYSVNNATTTIINTTGYYRVFGNFSKSTNGNGKMQLNDGTTTKDIMEFAVPSGSENDIELFDFNIFLKAGESLQIIASSNARINGCTRQIADISGNLVNPL